MKKLSYLIVSAVVAFAACSEKDGTDGPVIVNPDDVIVGKNEVLDDDIQKQKLEQVATKLMDLFPAGEFDNLLNYADQLASHCEANFDDSDYDWSELEEVGEDKIDDFYKETEKGSYKWEYTYTVFLSNCTGTITLGKNKAEYASSDDTKVIIKDVKGYDWEATLVSKDLKKVFLGEWIDQYYGYDYDEYGNWFEVSYEENYNLTVEIPNSLTFDLTRGGEFISTLTVNFDYSIDKNGLNYEKDRIGVSLDFKYDDIVITLDKAVVDASTGDVEYNVTLKKDDMFIMSQKVTANMDVYIEEDEGEYEGEINKITASVECNLIGELQIKGTCLDFEKLVDYTDASYDTEKECERAAAKATELVDLKVYYDCTPTVQATIEFEPVAYDEYWGEYYYVEPVIVFGDGSRYLFYEYFDERDFRDLIESFEDFIYDYEDMVEDTF